MVTTASDTTPSREVFGEANIAIESNGAKTDSDNISNSMILLSNTNGVPKKSLFDQAKRLFPSFLKVTGSYTLTPQQPTKNVVVNENQWLANSPDPDKVRNGVILKHMALISENKFNEYVNPTPTIPKKNVHHLHNFDSKLRRLAEDLKHYQVQPQERENASQKTKLSAGVAANHAKQPKYVDKGTTSPKELAVEFIADLRKNANLTIEKIKTEGITSRTLTCSGKGSGSLRNIVTQVAAIVKISPSPLIVEFNNRVRMSESFGVSFKFSELGSNHQGELGEKLERLNEYPWLVKEKAIQEVITILRELEVLASHLS